MSLNNRAYLRIQEGNYKPVKLEFTDGEFAVMQSFAAPKEQP
jgi:hypothetical protein